jgi:hypothetical protein
MRLLCKTLITAHYYKIGVQMILSEDQDIVYRKFKDHVENLLAKHREIQGNKHSDHLNAFQNIFRLAAIKEFIENTDDAFYMISALQDDQNLIDISINSTNFCRLLGEFCPEQLNHNKAWKNFAPTIIDFQRKGVGIGEMYMTVVQKGYVFGNTEGKSDGSWLGIDGKIKKQEIKKHGASIKPGTNDGDQEFLTEKFFDGNRPGPLYPKADKSNGHSYDRWLRYILAFDPVERKRRMTGYFSGMYHNNINDLDDIINADLEHISGQDFSDIIGFKCLKWYKEAEGWCNLTVIDTEKQMFYNIADLTDNLDLLRKDFPFIHFDWKTTKCVDKKKKGDTQAISAGYVNIKLTPSMVVRQKLAAEKKGATENMQPLKVRKVIKSNTNKKVSLNKDLFEQ